MNETKKIVISDENARQGEIILRTRWRKVVFFAGLAGAVIHALIASFLMR